jgi:hypothetical protein
VNRGPSFARTGDDDGRRIGGHGGFVVSKIDAAATEAAKVPEVAKALAAQGIESSSGTPEDLGKRIAKDLEGNRKLLADGVVKLE